VNLKRPYVAVGRVGETLISEDLWVVDDVSPERKLMRRIFPGVSAHGGWRKAFASIAPFLAQPSRGVAALIETGLDDEQRLCLVFAAHRPLPRWLAAPRTFAEAARFALDAVAVVEPTVVTLGAARAPLEPTDVDIDLDGEVVVAGAGVPALPPELGGAREGPHSLATAAAQLVAGWGFPLPHHVHDPRAAYDVLARAAAPDLPWRTRPPGIAEARRHLEALADSDVDEIARVHAALTLSRARGLEQEVVRLLVRCLNEPLAWLPGIAAEILSDWPEPFGVRVDDNGMLRRCPHRWASTEIVSELGGSSIERHCPDCDARVVLPQSIGTWAKQCEAARAFVDSWDERDPIEIVEPGDRRPLWRGQALHLGGAVDLINIGGNRLCLRRRTLPGEREIEAFLPGARVRFGNRIYRRAGEGIVVEMALD
jgi:hypothetical protein